MRDETQIELAISNRRLPGITVRKKFQDDALAEIFRERQVRLQRDAFFLDARQEAEQTRDGGIASVGRNKRARGDEIGPGFDAPAAVFP